MYYTIYSAAMVPATGVTYSIEIPGPEIDQFGQITPVVLTGQTVYRLSSDGTTIEQTFPNVSVAILQQNPTIPRLTTNPGENRVPVRPNGGAKGGFVVTDPNGNTPMWFPPGYGPLL